MERQKEKRKQILVSVVLIGILFVSIVGFGFQGNFDDDNKVEYNGYEFSEQGGYWITNIQDVDFMFQYNPTQIKTDDFNFFSLDKYYNKPLYIYSEDQVSEIELYSNIKYLVERVQNACIDGKTCLYENVPTKTCEDNLIIIEYAEESNITQEENCIYIKGPTQKELIINIDAFLFKLLNIE